MEWTLLEDRIHPTVLRRRCVTASVREALSAPIPSQQPLVHLRRPEDPVLLPVSAMCSTAMTMLPFRPPSPTGSVACSASNGSRTSRSSKRAIHRQQRLAEPSPTRNPLVYAAWRVLPTCPRHHLAVLAPRHPRQAVNRRSPRIPRIGDCGRISETGHYLTWGATPFCARSCSRQQFGRLRRAG